MSCPGQSSGLLTSATVVTDQQAVLLGAVVTNGTVVIYDSENTTTTGKVILASITAPATESVIFHVDAGVSTMKGIYITITGGNCTILYRMGA